MSKKQKKKKKEKLPNRFLLLSSKLDIQSSASGYGCPATTLLRLDGVNFWSRRLLPFPPPPLRLVTLFHFPRFVLSVRVFSKSIRRSSHAHTQKIGKETSGTGSRWLAGLDGRNPTKLLWCDMNTGQHFASRTDELVYQTSERTRRDLVYKSEST